MARSYSEIFIRELNKADQTHLGIRLGQICVKSQLPAIYVAKTLGVARKSLHLWFRGRPISDLYQAKIINFIDEVEKDLEAGSLPAKGLKGAKDYLALAFGTQI